MPSPSIIMIGLDAADPRLLERWMEAGLMPNLRAIRDRGVWGHLRTPPGLGDDAVWASLATGSTPGSHGHFFHRQPVAGTYSVRPFDQQSLGREPFWNVLSRRGKKLAIIDVPKNPLSTDLNGIQLCDWRVHGRSGETRSQPPELAPAILSQYGDDLTDKEPNYLCLKSALPESMQSVFVERLMTSIERKASATEMLLAADEWDLFLVVFKEAHCVGHHCWHLMDSTPSVSDAGRESNGSNPVQRIYRELDRTLGRLLKDISATTVVVVFSTIGMSANATGDALLDSVLLRLESSPLWSAWQRLVAFGSRSKVPVARQLIRRAHKRANPYRTAYPVDHNELSGSVRLNVEGREPKGRVPAASRNELLSRLRDEFLALVDLDSGLPVVAEVILSRDAFEGEKSDVHADMFIVWNRQARFNRVSSPTVGEISAPTPAIRSGNHVAGGIFFGCGGGIVPDPECKTAAVEDIAPSVMKILGQESNHVDGKPVAALLSTR